jgi:hypothetical protein
MTAKNHSLPHSCDKGLRKLVLAELQRQKEEQLTLTEDEHYNGQ